MHASNLTSTFSLLGADVVVVVTAAAVAVDTEEAVEAAATEVEVMEAVETTATGSAKTDTKTIRYPFMSPK